MGFINWLNTSARPEVAAHGSNMELLLAQIVDWQTNGSPLSDALGVASIFRARQLNADTVASLPVLVGDSPVPAPNRFQSSQEFIAEIVYALQDFGDAFLRVTPTGDVWVLDNDKMVVSWNADRNRRIFVYDNVQMRDAGSFPNLVVVSVNRRSGDATGVGWMQSGAIQAAVAAQKWAQEYFENNASPVGVLSTRGTLTKQEAELLKTQWVNARTVRTPAVLSGGMAWTGTSFDASSSQWVETNNAYALAAATLSGVPASLLNVAPSGTVQTYQNVQDIWRIYYLSTLKPTYLTRIAEAWGQVLGATVTFDVEALLIASMKDRVWSASELVRTGFDPAGSLDEVGMPPIPHTGEVPVTLQAQETTT